ncbi:MAG TPA: MXAN_6640 family putative metalloprotease [Candidatus Kapabacteria bacterium]|nr:MXAN_6640 family putative metalloprotease [Candidatus Kapabacteria bacterium]
MSSQQQPHTDAPPMLCGTMLWYAAHHPSSNAFSAGADADKLRRLADIELICDSRPPKEATLLSPGGHFRLHYDIQDSTDHVPLADLDGNGIPDFIDSAAFYLENTWNVEINQYGFLPPAPDNNRGGGPEVDVYFCQLDAKIYGFARPETDNPTGPNTVAGFLVLDNDYVGYPTPGIEGLRVTIPHEFNHIVQFSRYRFDFSQATLYEATSVWFEQQVEPGIPDYLQYVRLFLGAPQNYSFATQRTANTVDGYAHVLFMDMISKQLGRDIVRQVWEQFATANTAYDAIDLALRNHGTNLENSFCQFADWCYHTGGRTVDDTTYFKEARFFPTMKAVNVQPFDGTNELSMVTTLWPLSFGLYRVLTQPDGGGKRDTLDFIVTNARTDFGVGGPGLAQDNASIEISATEHSVSRPLTTSSGQVYFKLLAPSTQYCDDIIIGGQKPLFPTAHIAPQPFINDGGAQLLFGVNLAKDQVRKAKLSLYSSTMANVRVIEIHELDELNNQLGLAWDGRDSRGNVVPSGVYIYQLSINDGEPLMGKIAIIRK